MPSRRCSCPGRTRAGKLHKAFLVSPLFHLLLVAMVPTDWGHVTKNAIVQGLFSVVCRSEKPEGPHLCQTADKRGAKAWIWGQLPVGELIGGVGLQVTSSQPLHLCVQPSSFLYPVPGCVQADLTRVVDLCCGLGGFTHMLDRVGMTLTCGIDQNARWRELFMGLHPGAKFFEGDINGPDTIRFLAEHGCFHGVMCAGISCNAHSTMGDQLGMADPRSLSLPKALQTGYMMQSACLVLECTPAIMQDREAQNIIRQFAAATGYRVSQSLIQLSRAWCSRRERLFGLFCAPLLGIFYPPESSRAHHLSTGEGFDAGNA